MSLRIARLEKANIHERFSAYLNTIDSFIDKLNLPSDARVLIARVEDKGDEWYFETDHIGIVKRQNLSGFDPAFDPLKQKKVLDNYTSYRHEWLRLLEPYLKIDPNNPKLYIDNEASTLKLLIEQPEFLYVKEDEQPIILPCMTKTHYESLVKAMPEALGPDRVIVIKEIRETESKTASLHNDVRANTANFNGASHQSPNGESNTIANANATSADSGSSKLKWVLLALLLLLILGASAAFAYFKFLSPEAKNNASNASLTASAAANSNQGANANASANANAAKAQDSASSDHASSKNNADSNITLDSLVNSKDEANNASNSALNTTLNQSTSDASQSTNTSSSYTSLLEEISKSFFKLDNSNLDEQLKSQLKADIKSKLNALSIINIDAESKNKLILELEKKLLDVDKMHTDDGSKLELKSQIKATIADLNKKSTNQGKTVSLDPNDAALAPLGQDSFDSRNAEDNEKKDSEALKPESQIDPQKQGDEEEGESRTIGVIPDMRGSPSPSLNGKDEPTPKSGEQPKGNHELQDSIKLPSGENLHPYKNNGVIAANGTPGDGGPLAGGKGKVEPGDGSGGNGTSSSGKGEGTVAKKKLVQCSTVRSGGAKLIMATDGSGSMTSRLPDGVERIDAAINAAHAVIDTVDKKVPISYISIQGCPLAQYHGTFGATDRKALKAHVDHNDPRRFLFPEYVMTPLVSGMRIMGKQAEKEKIALGVLISDGVDTCEGTKNLNICDVARDIHRQAPNLKINVILIGNDAPKAQCVADITGGKVYRPETAQEIVRDLKAATVSFKKICK